jgi:hypothetical protein
MRLADYADSYDKIRLERTEGVLEVTLHTRGGEAVWGTSEHSLHNQLGHAFVDIARDPENKVVLLTGTGHTRTVLVRDLRRRLRDELEFGLAVEALATL